MVAVYAYIYSIYYFMILRDSSIDLNRKIMKMTPEQRKLIDMYGRLGMTQKAICQETGLSQDQLYNRFFKIRELFGQDGKPAELVQVVHIIASVNGKP